MEANLCSWYLCLSVLKMSSKSNVGWRESMAGCRNSQLTVIRVFHELASTNSITSGQRDSCQLSRTGRLTSSRMSWISSAARR